MERRRRSLCTAVAVAVAVAVALIATMPSTGEAAYGSSPAAASPPRLSPDYYSSSCPNLETIVRTEVFNKIQETVVTIPATLRLFFHDCMVEGCDASVLIASPYGQKDAEKDAEDNESLAGDGFDMVNRAKDAVEKQCPGAAVSCADILALTTRDVVYLSQGPYWKVELGRLDGLVSKASDVKDKLPSPDMHVKELIAILGKNGLFEYDLVALSGAHTVGFAHCTRFINRLYNYNSGQPTDPSMDKNYAVALKGACPPNVNKTTAVNMDPMSATTFDNKYYSNLVDGYGLFTSDQVLYTDRSTRDTVKYFAANQTAFFEAFMSSMLKLGRVGVKTGKDGEVRKVCTKFNH